MQTCAVESPLLALECAGVVLAPSSSLSSSSAVLALRFLVVLKGGLSSGVKGVFDSRAGLGERRCGRIEAVDDGRLLVPAELI